MDVNTRRKIRALEQRATKAILWAAELEARNRELSEASQAEQRYKKALEEIAEGRGKYAKVAEQALHPNTDE